MRTYRSSQEDELVVAESTRYAQHTKGTIMRLRIKTDGYRLRAGGPWQKLLPGVYLALNGRVYRPCPS